MTRRISLVILATLVAMVLCGVSAFADVDTPSYDVREMTAEELGVFFSNGNKDYNGDVIGAVYSALDKPELSAFGVVYTAVEDYDTAVKSPWANHIVDFEIVSESDISVLLVGNYGNYGTIPAGIFNLKAGVPVSIMESMATLPGFNGWANITYADITLLVKEFKCAALPLTEDLLRAYHSVAGEGEYNEAAVLELLRVTANPLGESGFAKIDRATDISLAIELFATELDENGNMVKTGEKVKLGEDMSFVSYPTAPLYESSVLDREALDAFFADPNPKYSGDLIKAIYDNINDPTASVFGMNFKSVEDYETAINAPYAYYNPDFLVSSDKDVSAILLGNYGKYKTIPMGIVNIKAGESVRVVDLLMGIKPEWACCYSDAVLFVKDFDGAAIILSDDVVRAIYRVMCDNDAEFLMAHNTYSEETKQAVLEALASDPSFNPFGAEAFTIADEGATISLDVKLFETELVDGEYVENGKSQKVNKDNSFDYTPVEKIDFMQKLLIVNNMTAKDGYNKLCVAAAVDSLSYSEVGFKVTVVDMGGNYLTQTHKLTTDTVYSSIRVSNALGTGESVYTAEQLGGRYAFGGELLLNATAFANSNTKIIITPYAIDRQGKEILGKETTLTDGIIKNRTPASALFRN